MRWNPQRLCAAPVNFRIGLRVGHIFAAEDRLEQGPAFCQVQKEVQAGPRPRGRERESVPAPQFLQDLRTSFCQRRLPAQAFPGQPALFLRRLRDDFRTHRNSRPAEHFLHDIRRTLPRISRIIEVMNAVWRKDRMECVAVADRRIDQHTIQIEDDRFNHRPVTRI